MTVLVVIVGFPLFGPPRENGRCSFHIFLYFLATDTILNPLVGIIFAALNSPGPWPIGVCDHLLVVRLLIPRRECQDPPGDRSVPRVPPRDAFSTLWRSTAPFVRFVGPSGRRPKIMFFWHRTKTSKIKG